MQRGLGCVPWSYSGHIVELQELGVKFWILRIMVTVSTIWLQNLAPLSLVSLVGQPVWVK